MSKWYEVEVIAYKTVLVEVKDNEGKDEAHTIAQEGGFPFENDVDTNDIIRISPKQLKSAKKSADDVFSL